MSSSVTARDTAPLSADAMLRAAVAHHEAGRLLEAGQLYQAILAAEPGHAEANHNLGVVAVQARQPESGLPYFVAALGADPTRGQYWLNYIDALFQAGHHDDARAVLALARQQGLDGEAVEALAARLGERAPATGSGPDADAGAADATSARTAAPARGDVEALMALFGARRYADAADAARRMTEGHPRHPFGWKMLGAALKLQGRDLDALAPMREATALDPVDAEAHYNLGVVLQALGRLDEAEASYRQALVIDARYADAYLNLGALLNATGRLDAAETALRHAAELKPQASEAHANLGGVLNALGRHAEAEASLRRALELKPANAVAHNALGVALQALGRMDEAEASYGQAIEHAPELAEAHRNLGALCLERDRLDAADAHLRRALELDPTDTEALGSRGNLLCRMERLDEAEACFRAALAIAPTDAIMHANLGRLLRDERRFDEAATHLREALRLDPDNRETRYAFGNTLVSNGHVAEAEACYRSILETDPHNPSVLNNLGNALMNLGRIEEAAAAYRQGVEHAPDSELLGSNLLYALTLGPETDAETLFAAHRAFGERFEARLKPHWPVHANARDPERRLQVGLVSADFCDHAVASFVEPVLRCLAGHAGLALHAYHNHFLNDAVTARLRACFDHWHPVSGLSDAELADKIRADGIDILIDLSGHTGYNRLLTFARKPAPVQATWIGYPGTTGLSAVDYYLTDRHTLPPGRFDGQFTEKLVHLPANSPFLPVPDAPPVNALPARTRGHVTFGSFSRPNKIGRAVVAVWSAIMRAVPDSRMLLGGMPENGGHAGLAAWFAEEGIEAARLDFHPRRAAKDYLRLHHEIDIGLDTFPYNNGTTTLHALWMGVPTLTLAGNTVAGRSGASILGHAGLEAFVAEDTDDFIARGVAWCGRLDELSMIREGLRERFAASPRGQPAIVAVGVARALRMMWRRWCAGLPPASFEVPRDGGDAALKEGEA